MGEETRLKELGLGKRGGSEYDIVAGSMLLRADMKPSKCNICEYIIAAMVGSPSSKRYRGSYSLRLSYEHSICRVHATLIKRFREHFSPKSKFDISVVRDELFPGVRIYSGNLDLGYWRLLLKRGPNPAHPGTGHILQPNWIDLDILSRWKKRCLQEHGLKCENPLKIGSVRPAWVIDVRNKCVVPGMEMGSDGYVALSYRWGKSSSHKVEGNVMAKLQKPNALESSEFGAMVPPMVRHAMYLTTEIGERYLWVDALCIDHQDKTATTDQLNLMSAIYANAIVTIVAADEDAQVGIIGLKGISGPRKLKQHVIPFGREDLVIRNTDVDVLASGSDYHSRCWTYQEYMMAQRRIIFSQKEVHWHCPHGVSHEETGLEVETDRSIELRLGSISAGFPDLEAYHNIVSDYNRRSLTYDEDALPGISGLLYIASRAFTGGFLFGLPLMFFDLVLGWRPDTNSELRRRVQSSRPVEERLTPSGLPSWSWIGWQGVIRIAADEAIQVGKGDKETIPITKWFTCAGLHSSRKRIHSTWFEDRESFKNFERPLPPGWSRSDNIGPINCAPHGCHKWVFEHCKQPKRNTVSTSTPGFWYYPFPVKDVQESTPFLPAQTPYLCCSTKKVILLAQVPKDRSGFHSEIKLRTPSWKEAGSLYLHNREQLDILVKRNTAMGAPVELAAIYLSRRYFYDSWNKRQDFADTYEVLWLEWKDGIAYRLAFASVDRKIWEGLHLQDINLVLG
ncbi:heterokaryon incompatibility protein-domain-containing protein [Camillea tinctor]|nr:heterokaryon incompatibility protein-domain-containing protein [Camillea tinctor]